MVDCNDKDGSHCFTTQRTLGDGSVTFKRGCSAPLLAGLKEGKLVITPRTVNYRVLKAASTPTTGLFATRHARKKAATSIWICPTAPSPWPDHLPYYLATFLPKLQLLL